MRNAQSLALRDPALAALVGVELGADFGIEGEFGDDMNGDFGDDYGTEVGGDFGAEPSHAQLLAAWRKGRRGPSGRGRLLRPNAGSSEKVQRYAFTVAPAANPVFSTGSAVTMSGNPRVTVRPQRVVCNVPAPGLFTVSAIEIANVNALIGSGATDGYIFNANGTGVALDLPTITPAYPVSVTGTWTTLLPTGYVGAAAFPLSMTFIGPADMVG